MFIFFINDIFYSFWQNKKGQQFFDLTCAGLNLSPTEVSLNYYEGINEIPPLFDFDENKNLLIKEKVITEVLVGPEGEQVLEEQISYNIKETILAEVFVINGEKFKTC